jgi:hypothetical protein
LFLLIKNPVFKQSTYFRSLKTLPLNKIFVFIYFFFILKKNIFRIMSFHNFQHYTFDTDLPSESPADPELMLRNLLSQLQSRQFAASSPAPTLINLNPLPIIHGLQAQNFQNY